MTHPGIRFLTITLILLAASACNKPPEASAGPDQVFFERSKVTLTGQGTDPNKKDKLSFHWRQLNGEMVTDAEGQTTEKFSFTLPAVSNDEKITMSFTVTDEKGEQAQDTVDISVKAYTSLAKLSMTDPAFDKCAQNKLYYLAWDDMGNAKTLDCTGVGIKSLEGIQNLPNLEELVIQNNDVSDLSSIQTLRNLKKLNVSGNQLTSLVNLSMLRNLAFLSATSNPIMSLKGVEKLTQLEELYLGKSGINDKEIKFIKNLKKLKRLYLNDNNVENVFYLANLDSVEQLYLHNNNIRDPSPLLNLENIKRLYLEGNPRMDCRKVQSLKHKFGSKVTAPSHCR